MIPPCSAPCLDHRGERTDAHERKSPLPPSHLSLTFVPRVTPKGLGERPGSEASSGARRLGGDWHALSLQGTAASSTPSSVRSIGRTCPPVSATAAPRTPGRRPAACGVSWWSPSCWQALGQCPFSRLGSPTWTTSRSPTTRPCTSVSPRLEEGCREGSGPDLTLKL